MAIARDTTAANIKPLSGAIVRKYTSGAAIAAGELCEMQSDGYMDPCNAGTTVLGLCGVAIQAAAGSGEVLDFVMLGPVKCLTGATPGALVYGTNTAGEPDHTGGTKKTAYGHAESATVLFVDPQIVDFS